MFVGSLVRSSYFILVSGVMGMSTSRSLITLTLTDPGVPRLDGTSQIPLTKPNSTDLRTSRAAEQGWVVLFL